LGLLADPAPRPTGTGPGGGRPDRPLAAPDREEYSSRDRLYRLPADDDSRSPSQRDDLAVTTPM